MNKETSLQTLGQRQRLLEWSQKVADCRQSGLSVKRWCSENGTSVKTYYSWQKKVFEFIVSCPLTDCISHNTPSPRCFT